MIVVIGSNSVSKKVALKELEGGGSEFEVSAAQDAVVRVFERMLEVVAENNGGETTGEEAKGGVVLCRVLAESSQVGAVIGKGGKVIEKIREETGCKIRVLKGEKLPSCALPNEELIEIEGDSLAVKKALITVSCRLQDFPPAGRPQMGWTLPHEAIPQETFHNVRGAFTRQNSVLPPMPAASVTYASGGYPFSIEAERVPTLASRTEQEVVVYRLLCSNDRVGGVIGKGGTIVKALQNETGASISFGGSMAECDERLITISAIENPESRYSPAQNAVILVFNRSVEAGFEKGLDSGSSNGSSVSARVVVSSDQVGCLMGKGGAIIEEMRQATGASISIMKHGQVPKCASEGDEVVQIAGQFVCVQDALYNVTSRLRDNLFPVRIANGAGIRSSSAMATEMSHYGIARDPSSIGSYKSIGVSNNLNRHSSVTPSTDHFGFYHNYEHHPLSQETIGGVNPGSTLDVARGLTSVKGALELGSGIRSAFVTNTTVEIVVPKNVIGSVYGENGNNLARLRQISGAKVVVHEPHPGTTDRVVVISGTPDETQAAQSLLQAFILTGQS